MLSIQIKCKKRAAGGGRRASFLKCLRSLMGSLSIVCAGLCCLLERLRDRGKISWAVWKSSWRLFETLLGPKLGTKWTLGGV